MYDTDLLFGRENLTSTICAMKPAVSIIIPAFEEQDRLGDSVREILRFIETEKLSAELIIVDDGSDDKTAEIGETVCAEFPDLQTKVIRYEENRGKGFAVKTGLLASNADIAIFSDADLSTPIEELYKLIEPIQKGEYDVTFGSRALDRSLISTHQPCSANKAGT